MIFHLIVEKINDLHIFSYYNTKTFVIFQFLAGFLSKNKNQEVKFLIFLDYFTSKTMDLTFVIASMLYLIPCTPAPEPFTSRNGKLSGPRCVLLLI